MTKVEYRHLPELKGDQALASQPRERVWLSASAGTGKTQVLTARVLRLLLNRTKPETILCLTFTKAGAAEMKERINARLGAWVRAPGPDLSKDLRHLGEAFGPDDQAHARTLFAQVLDARGGGLRILTIHSFCQTLLGSFPAEAGLIPGFRPVEGREEAALRNAALADLVVLWEREGRIGAIDRLKALAARLGEDGARSFLARCAAAPDAMEAINSLPPSGGSVEAKVRYAVTNGIDDIDSVLALACSDDGIDKRALIALCDMFMGWRTKAGAPRAAGLKAVERISEWLASTIEQRIASLDMLRRAWRKADGDWPVAAPDDDAFCSVVEAMDERVGQLRELHVVNGLSAVLANGLIVGQDYARQYADSKRTAGVIDFNDLIRKTVALLAEPDMGEWIRYKLDQATDHILIDEAQDTNAEQWAIVKALAAEFFAGDGAKGRTRRTLFTVGDYKQAIFGFQGTDPQEFNLAHTYFGDQAAQAGGKLLDLSLRDSFRSGPPVLAVVDRLLDDLGHEALGLPRPDPSHISARGGSGSVTLWPPIAGIESDDEGDEGDDDAEEQWLGDAALSLAKDIASRVKHWTSGGLNLRNQGDRPARPEDVLILLRSRGELARQIVSRLHEAGVPVAGVDRLRLGAPIAVMDLLACIRFALQPEDDLSLAALLVSPLVGWTQDELYARAKQRKSTLWEHLGPHRPEALKSILSMADLTTPYRFLEAILSGPIAGRAKLIARLGEEARDPIEELLNQSLAFGREAVPSLQLFLDWFDRGDVEIKRDPSKPENAVRVMTVHGAKGLQAPIVVLADATHDPDQKPGGALDWPVEGGLKLPIIRPRKAELVAALKDAADLSKARDREEHWRLLYVAMTRAEEHLFIGGALSKKQLKGMKEDCWHMRIGAALRGLGAESDAVGALVHGHEAKPLPAPTGSAADERLPDTLPDWLRAQAPEEARPPRPLAPSAILPLDDEASPPPDAKMREAAQRGKWLHSLFERLPAITPDRREAVADHWLANSAGVADSDQRARLIGDALAVIEHPDFAAIFAPDALAEAPLAGIVGDRVIAGTVDRLLVNDTHILVVDFKTGRRVPSGLEAVTEHHIAQMAAYVAVLRGIFPDHAVRAALLYTSGPRLIPLSDTVIEAHKPGYRDQQDKLGTAA